MPPPDGRFLPQEVRDNTGFLRLSDAIKQAHYPDSETSKDAARRRLAFDELFLIQLGVLARKRDWEEGEKGVSLDAEVKYLANFLDSLPFELTQAQKRVLDEIQGDLVQTKPMSRCFRGKLGAARQ